MFQWIPTTPVGLAVTHGFESGQLVTFIPAVMSEEVVRSVVRTFPEATERLLLLQVAADGIRLFWDFSSQNLALARTFATTAEALGEELRYYIRAAA